MTYYVAVNNDGSNPILFTDEALAGIGEADGMFGRQSRHEYERLSDALDDYRWLATGRSQDALPPQI